MIAVAGNSGIHKFIWYYIRAIFRDNSNIIVVDAANKFDPYLISNICVAMKITPYTILENIFIARAFTPFQMLKLIEKILFFKKTGKNFLFILLGFTTLLDDDNISHIHAMKIFRKSLSYLSHISPAIITLNRFDRRGYYKVVEKKSKVFIEDTSIVKPLHLKKGVNKLWAGQLHLLHTY